MKFYIENLQHFGILQAYSPPTFYIENRPTHALVFRHRGAIDYDFGYWQTCHKPGEALLIPKGSTFTAVNNLEEESKYTVFSFLGDFSITHAIKLPLGEDQAMIYALLDQCVCLRQDQDRYLILSYFYKIISLLAKNEEEETSRFSWNTLAIIEPALEMLRKNLYDPNLKAGQLHTVCGISDAYFRSIFIDKFGVSPKKYMIDQRLTHAKQLLEYGECRSVSDAAHFSGFEDPLYFSRVFKARYGYPPSKGIIIR